MHALLLDPARTSLQTVPLPEELPVYEPIHLRRMVEALHIPPGHDVVNGVEPPLFNRREYEDYQVLRELTGHRYPELNSLYDAAQWQIQRWRNQEEHLSRIRRQLNVPRVELPFVYDRTFRARAIEFLAQKMIDQLRRNGG